MGYDPHANVFELFDCKMTEIFICEKILTTSAIPVKNDFQTIH
jgi:hypothetical protein